jgi:hypothetical protein
MSKVQQSLAVRKHALDSLLVDSINFMHSVELSLHTWRFAPPEVALHPFCHHDLASRGDLKPPLGSLVRFQLLLRHGVGHPLSRVDSAFA